MLRRLLPAFAVTAGVLLSGAPAAASPAPAADGSALRIMPLGDSITAGVGVAGKDGYRLRLQRSLEKAGVAVDYVGSQRGGTAGDPDHEGHGGWTIDQLANRTTAWVQRYDPDVVLLHAGTNNITRGEDPAAVAGKLSGLIDRVRAAAPGAQVFVARIIGTAVPAEVPANQAYNALIPDVVAGKDERVHLVDQSPVDDLSIYDRHHPNAYGYAWMAYTWYSALRTVIGPSWPAANDPDDTDMAYLCHFRTVKDCRWWQRRPVTTVVDGQPVRTVVWHTRRLVTVTYRAEVPARYETVTRRVWVEGRHVKRVWVKGHYEKRNYRVWTAAGTVTKTRTVASWVRS